MDKPFRAYNGPEPCIFVSYSHNDTDAVFKCIARLHEDGFRIWYDEGIPPGANWYQILADRLSRAACVLLFLSESSQTSQYISKEATCAISQKKPIICVVLDGCRVTGAFELMLCDTQMLDLGDSAFYDKLKNALRPDETREEGRAAAGKLSEALRQTLSTAERPARSPGAGASPRPPRWPSASAQALPAPVS